ncbi:hypothetical protein Pmani_035580 [Petrolisthes manimaculis]|uniref:Uncharacterized protein n=1 Tax=Petrolisthes manimaculis TaxID=1843537 RepID=A0AAE1NM43_9EUCA|nr:hypothetical protein Pmani_035580 [Petrolisthes manimaculis]
MEWVVGVSKEGGKEVVVGEGQGGVGGGGGKEGAVKWWEGTRRGWLWGSGWEEVIGGREGAVKGDQGTEKEA